MRYLSVLLALVTVMSTADEGFPFSVMDVFKVTGGEVEFIITGKVESGTVSAGDSICLRSAEGSKKEPTVGAIEKFGTSPDSAKAGDMVGIGVGGIDKDDVSKGDTLSASCEG